MEDLTDDQERVYKNGLHTCLNQILQRCTSLEHLILISIDLLPHRKLDKNSINSSVKSLEFSCTAIDRGALDRPSRRLPLVNRLVLANSTIGFPTADSCVMPVDMPMSELDNVTWRGSMREVYPINKEKFLLHVREIDLGRAGEKEIGLADEDGAYFNSVNLDYEGGNSEYDYVDNTLL